MKMPDVQWNLDIVIPTLNEATVIGQTLARVLDHLDNFGYYRVCDFRVIVADNGSTDSTRAIVQDWSERRSAVVLSALEKRGRGRALRAHFMGSEADIVCYMVCIVSTFGTADGELRSDN